MSLPSGSSRCDLSSPGAPSLGELPAEDNIASAVQGSLNTMTSNEAPAGNASMLITQEFEGESSRRTEKSERGSNRGNLLHAWEDNTSENQKSYNSSKFERKEKSRGEVPKRHET
jgi:hypothetical protein